MNVKEGTFMALDKPNIEHQQVGTEYENDVDEGRSTLCSSATIESQHQFLEASGVNDFMLIQIWRRQIFELKTNNQVCVNFSCKLKKLLTQFLYLLIITFKNIFYKMENFENEEHKIKK